MKKKKTPNKLVALELKLSESAPENRQSVVEGLYAKIAQKKAEIQKLIPAIAPEPRRPKNVLTADDAGPMVIAAAKKNPTPKKSVPVHHGVLTVQEAGAAMLRSFKKKK